MLKPGARGGRTSVVVRWRAPQAIGSHPVQRYRITLRRVDASGRAYGRTRSVTVDGRTYARDLALPKGRWTARVRAGSQAGWSGWTAWSRPVRSR